MVNQKDKQKKQFIILGVVLLLVIVVAYFGFFQDKGVSDVGILDTQTVTAEQIRFISVLGIGVDFLNGDLFQSLAINGDIPINVQLEGRNNPFVPY